MPGTQATTDPSSVQLQPLELWFLPTAGPLLPQVRAALEVEARLRMGEAGTGFAEALRWGITAVDAERGLRLEGVLVLAPARLPAAEGG